MLLFYFAMTKAFNVCFDLEAGHHGGDGIWDDETNESTNCNICARAASGGYWLGKKKCKKGIINKTEWGNPDCIRLHERTATAKLSATVYESDIYVQTDCGDGLWIDTLSACENIVSSGQCVHRNERVWGSHNTKGWCLSTDAGDYKHFGYAKASACWRTLKFKRNGKVGGWRPSSRQPTLRGVDSSSGILDADYPADYPAESNNDRLARIEGLLAELEEMQYPEARSSEVLAEAGADEEQNAESSSQEP